MVLKRNHSNTVLRKTNTYNTTLNNKTQASWCDMTLTQILDADYMARSQSVRLAQRCEN